LWAKVGRKTPAGVVWIVGPPGKWLQRYVREWAREVEGYGWEEPERLDDPLSWLNKYHLAARQPVAIDEREVWGEWAMWTSMRERMTSEATWIGCKLEFLDSE
jgi:hypothetical protein